MSGAYDAALPPALPAIELIDARTDPLAFLDRTSQRYGDVFRYALDGWSAVVVNDPFMARRALQFDGEWLTKEGTPDLMMLRPMLGQGLMTDEGAAWHASRMASQPAFGAPRIAGYVPQMWDCIEAMLAVWQSETVATPVRDLEREFNQLTLRIVGNCLFHTDLSDNKSDLGLAVEVMNRCVSHFDPADVTMPQRFAAAHAQLHQLLQPIAHAAAPRHSLLAALRARAGVTEYSVPDAVPDAVTDATPDATGARMLRDEIVTFLMAGHETTAKALTWAMHLLAGHPAVCVRVRAEAQAGLASAAPAQVLDTLPYTWQVLQEVLRLYPPVWLMSRRALRTFTLGDYTVEAGSLVVISPYLLHRHPAHWNAPGRFDPDRFARGHEERDAGAYMPFGAGNRVCIGRLFAAAETTLALARVVQRFDVVPASASPVIPEALVTLRPRNGMPMTLRPVP